MNAGKSLKQKFSLTAERQTHPQNYIFAEQTRISMIYKQHIFSLISLCLHTSDAAHKRYLLALFPPFIP